MNNLNACIADLTANYSAAVLADYAAADDGAYTIADHGCDFDINTIHDALNAIVN